MSKWVKQEKDFTIIKVHISNGKTDEIVGLMDNKLKIKISKPPKGNKANTRLIEFLSSKLNIPKSQIKIIKGAKNKNKTVLINNIIKSTLLVDE